MEILIESANTLFEKSPPSPPTGLPEPINTHSSLTLQNSVAFRQSEEAQVAGFNPQWSRHSTITSISSSSLSRPPHVPLLFFGGLIEESDAEAATRTFGAAES